MDAREYRVSLETSSLGGINPDIAVKTSDLERIMSNYSNTHDLKLFFLIVGDTAVIISFIVCVYLACKFKSAHLMYTFMCLNGMFFFLSVYCLFPMFTVPVELWSHVPLPLWQRAVHVVVIVIGGVAVLMLARLVWLRKGQEVSNTGDREQLLVCGEKDEILLQV